MYIDAPTKSAQYAQSSSRAGSGELGTDTTQTFLTLLMTQLKTQDPLSPMDPKEMVSQLVQFNTLGQIMEIRQLLETQQTGTDASNDTTAPNADGGH
ncbi:MAG TPA: flagellar hook capping FlgD N-terminal domain-containing protein [Terriglobales bacterium]|nr:flagellar hook capping FlgD N-terminal domain-containing protein [Terriglobales bacterium]